MPPPELPPPELPPREPVRLKWLVDSRGEFVKRDEAIQVFCSEEGTAEEILKAYQWRYVPFVCPLELCVELLTAGF